MRHGFDSLAGYATVLLFGSLFFAPQAAPAAEEVQSEQAYLQDLPVVLSASRLSQPISEAPNAMTVIDRDTIHASGYRNVADLFRLVPGMYVGYQDGYSPFVSYHGSTDNYARRMQVLIDGRSVYLPPFGQVDWADIPLHIDDIERIEVIRGPAAASHGANSTQGVINIITRDASAVRGGSVSISKGEAAISDTVARLAGAEADVDYRLTLGERSDTGYASKVMNDSSSTRLANFRANYRPNTTDSIDIQLGYSEGTRGIGTVGRVTEPFRDIQTRSDFEQIEWTRAMQQGDEIKLRYYHITRHYSDTAIPAIGTDVVSVQRDEVELQHILALGESNRVVWGGGTRTDTLDDPLSFARPAPTTRQSRLFAHDEWRITQSAILNIGTMLENDGLGHRNNSPRLSLNYHVTPLDTVRIGVSRAYRTPVAFEEYSNTQYAVGGKQYTSTGGLRPERILSREIAYIGEFPAMGMTLDSRIYSDSLSELIFLDPNPDGSLGFKNLYNITVRGLESTLKYRWGEGSSVILNYAHQRMSCNASASLTLAAYNSLLQTYIDQCPRMVPLDSGSIMLVEQVTQDVAFTIGYFNQGTLQLLDALEPQKQMNRVDIRIARSFGNLEKSGGGEVALVVQNAFQDNYTEFANTPQKSNLIFDRRTYLTATIHF
ncbi:MAG: TonB-dependent receptor [Nitrosomonadales bacterium]|nr:TonB-dependent receptor [Nitrosomonadales bacterium]